MASAPRLSFGALRAKLVATAAPRVDPHAARAERQALQVAGQQRRAIKNMNAPTRTADARRWAEDVLTKAPPLPPIPLAEPEPEPAAVELPAAVSAPVAAPMTAPAAAPPVASAAATAVGPDTGEFADDQTIWAAIGLQLDAATPTATIAAPHSALQLPPSNAASALPSSLLALMDLPAAPTADPPSLSASQPVTPQLSSSSNASHSSAVSWSTSTSLTPTPSASPPPSVSAPEPAPLVAFDAPKLRVPSSKRTVEQLNTEQQLLEDFKRDAKRQRITAAANATRQRNKAARASAAAEAAATAAIATATATASTAVSISPSSSRVLQPIGAFRSFASPSAAVGGGSTAAASVTATAPPAGDGSDGHDLVAVGWDDDAQLSPSQAEVVESVARGASVFFSGAAGTGKSFLTHRLVRAHSGAGGCFITASTGLAAINIGGTTLHSFAGVGLGREPLQELVKSVSGGAAGKRWRECRVLIVDEVSMVDAELWDKLEALARAVRKSNKPFGGIQLVVSGDFLQLPPVAPTNNRWGKGASASASASSAQFCFQAKSWSSCFQRTILLEKVYRQSDPVFVDLLNALRMGECTPAATAALQRCTQRSLAALTAADGIEPTQLYTKKVRVESENEQRLTHLPGDAVTFVAVDEGEGRHLTALQKGCPAAERLVLKAGAQVMLCKNIDAKAGLVNGSRGVVVGFTEEPVEDFDDVSSDRLWPVVQFACGVRRTIGPDVWRVEIHHRIVAQRAQVPLILAWALTVHKCQGMTLDRAVVSLHDVFEDGQAYVALSRVRSLDGLKLTGFKPSAVRASSAALEFYRALAAQQRARSAPAKPKAAPTGPGASSSTALSLSAPTAIATASASALKASAGAVYPAPHATAAPVRSQFSRSQPLPGPAATVPVPVSSSAANQFVAPRAVALVSQFKK